MDHAIIAAGADVGAGGKGLLARATGRFYTPPFIVRQLIETLTLATEFGRAGEARVVDPFCGDGRLLTAFLRRVCALGIARDVRWRVSCWDLDEVAVTAAAAAVRAVADELGLIVEIDARCRDTFLEAPHDGAFDVVITNPPWESLKPDKRELEALPPEGREAYQTALRAYDRRLALALPLSQPTSKYSGWGTNLSRCGTEVALRLTAPGGICGVVAPASLLADQTSAPLRRWMGREATWLAIDHYPAEARLFEGVDQPCVTLALRHALAESFRPVVTRHDRDGNVRDRFVLALSPSELRALDYCLPVEQGSAAIGHLGQWAALRTVGDLEGQGGSTLWAGRELDETDHARYLAPAGRFRFLKGRMVGRYAILEQPTLFVREDLRRIPPTASHPRIAWRDVSRRTQARRVQATLIPPGMVTGNSLHVAHFRDDDVWRLRALLAVVNSIPFEFQVRARLGTGHISLGAVRQARVPDLHDRALVARLSAGLAALESGDPDGEIALEIAVARAYGLDRPGFEELLAHFDRLPPAQKDRFLAHPTWDTARVTAGGGAR